MAKIDERCGTAENVERCRDGRCCGECDRPGRVFYVSVVDGSRYGLLAGPYDAHQDALDNVKGARAMAEAVDPRAVWYSFGTVLIEPVDETHAAPKAVFGCKVERRAA